MHIGIYLTKLFIISCVIHGSIQQFLPRRTSPDQLEGRIAELDNLLELHISDINSNDPGNLDPVIEQAKELAAKAVDKEMAKYYVQLLTDINEKGADFINDERDRLHVILQSTNPRAKGAEYEHARLQNNVLEGIVDFAAQDVMRMMQELNPDMEMWNTEELYGKNQYHDEV